MAALVAEYPARATAAIADVLLTEIVGAVADAAAVEVAAEINFNLL